MIEEKIIIGENTQYPLNGLLTLPNDTAKPVPAVVFVHGSGASNMDEKVGKLTPFKDLAQGLARRGIASVRYDKRSFAHGFKMLRDKGLEVTVKTETIDDAILATELLKKDPRIDPERVFIIGHSMGGMLAPRIDAEGGNYAGLIIMAGSPRKLEEIILDQNEAALRSTKGFVNWIVKKQVMQKDVILAGDLNIFRGNMLDGRILSYILNHIVNTEIARVAQGKSVVHVQASEISKIEISYPDADAQKKMISMFEAVAEKIICAEKQLEALSDLRRGLLQQLILCQHR